MRGGVQLTIGLAMFLFVHGVAGRCDREPEDHQSPKTPADDRFKIKISGNPDKYVPGEVYTVTLQGERIQHTPQRFTGFMLVVEPSVEWGPGGSDLDAKIRNVGSFSLFADTLSKFSERCPNAIVQTSSIPKTEIQVLWTAPSAGNGCVVFRATVVEHRDLWYMDDGPLSRILCEAVQENDDDQPEVVDPCCACEEAKYEVTFEGLWSRHTHPKSFPPNGWITRFSDVIGASHSVDYYFWQYGKYAKDGLRQVAERGSTRKLESELKNHSQDIRTIIKARGISYPNVTGKTFAVFRVDRKHHLVSLVSMIDPSPDWIVGVAGLELCLRNCTWIEHKVMNLYPWDVGTDSGITYIAPDKPTVPRDVIRRITSSYPNDMRSPFYDPSGEEMKPMARLYLTRQRLYEKSCSEEGDGNDDGEESHEDYSLPSSGDCGVTDWSEWSPCSVTCGKGIRYKQRHYIDYVKSSMKSCNYRLTARQACYAAQRTCMQDEEDPYNMIDPMCAVTDWSPWSSCSVTCGKGVRTRVRAFQHRSEAKRCGAVPNSPSLEQTDTCYETPCDGEEEIDTSAGFEETNCPLTKWSMWSPCSVTCGKGRRIRTRLPIAKDNDMIDMLRMNNDEGYSVPLSFDDCSSAQTVEEVDCQGAEPSCEITPEMAKEICQLPKDVGPCRGSNHRWFFDINTSTCEEFSYTGCKGNRNNFLTLDECENTCKAFRDDLDLEQGSDENGDPLKGMTPASHTLDRDLNVGLSTRPTFTVDGDDDDSEPVDCEVSRWGPWSECSVTCGRGRKHRTRNIIVEPKNGGKPCPKLIKKKKCKRRCEGDERTEDEDINPTWGPARPTGRVEPQDCIMSEWTPWSPCSLTCGLNGVRMRTRSVLQPNKNGGKPCDLRLDMAPCELAKPCDE